MSFYPYPEQVSPRHCPASHQRTSSVDPFTASTFVLSSIHAADTLCTNTPLSPLPFDVQHPYRRCVSGDVPEVLCNDTPLILPTGEAGVVRGLADDVQPTSTVVGDGDKSVSFLSSSPTFYSSSFPSFPVPSTSPSGTGQSIKSRSCEPGQRRTASLHVRLKKHRVRESNPEQRLERRRAQHRAVDKVRRLKENVTINRLHKLIKAQQVESLAPMEEGERVAQENEEKMDSKKVGRSTVLESSAAMIEQLTSACKRMEAACNAKDAQLNRVYSYVLGVTAMIAQQAISAGTDSSTNSSSHNAIAPNDGIMTRYGFPPSHHPLKALASTPSLTSSDAPVTNDTKFPSDSFLPILPSCILSYLAYSDRSHALRVGGHASFSSTLCVAIIAPPGIILDVNTRFLECTGWLRSDLVHTSLESEDGANFLPLSPLVQLPQTVTQASRQTRYLPQYPAATALLEAVKRGEKRKADITCRCSMVDGAVFECDCTVWGEWDEPLGEGQRRPPDRMVFVFEMESSVVIERVGDLVMDAA